MLSSIASKGGLDCCDTAPLKFDIFYSTCLMLVFEFFNIGSLSCICF